MTQTEAFLWTKHKHVAYSTEDKSLLKPHSYMHDIHWCMVNTVPPACMSECEVTFYFILFTYKQYILCIQTKSILFCFVKAVAFLIIKWVSIILNHVLSESCLPFPAANPQTLLPMSTFTTQSCYLVWIAWCTIMLLTIPALTHLCKAELSDEIPSTQPIVLA